MTVVDASSFVDRTTAQARTVPFWKTLLTVLAAFLFGIGWLAGKVLTLLWVGIVWCGLAVRAGWREARSGAREAGG